MAKKKTALDPFQVAVADCEARLGDDPGRLIFDLTPDCPDGLNAAAVNELAHAAGFADVFTQWTDADGGVWLAVNHPDGREPVKWLRRHPVRPCRHWTDAKVARTVAGLAAWREARTAKSNGATRRTRKRRSEPTPLTTKQAEAVHMVGESAGNIAKAARLAGVDRKTLEQHYNAAMKKMGAGVVKRATQPLPSDRRGQCAADADRRR